MPLRTSRSARIRAATGWWCSPTPTIPAGTLAWTGSRSRSMKWISRSAVYLFPKERTGSGSVTDRVPFTGARLSRSRAFWEQQYSPSGVERTGALLTHIIIDRGWSPRGIVFDMDGVLLNSSPIHAAAYQEVLAGLSISNFSYSRVAGMRSSDGMRAILNENRIHLPDERIAALAKAKSAIALARILEENPIVPGEIGRAHV